MQAVDTVLEIYKAQAAGLGEKALSFCSDDVRFQWPVDPNHATYAGEEKGSDKFLQRLASLGRDFEYHSLKPIDIVASGDRVAVQIELSMTRRDTGRSFVMRCADFWTLRNGKVVEFVEYYDTALVAWSEG